MVKMLVFVFLLVNIVLLTHAQLLIAVPNTNRPSDQIFNPTYLQQRQSNPNGGQPEAQTNVGPNGGLTITIKLQPHVMAALQGKTHGIQAAASYNDNSVVKSTRAPYPAPNIYYGNYNPNQQDQQHQQRRPQQQQHQLQQPQRHQYRGSPNSIIQQSHQLNVNPQYGGQGQGHQQQPYSTIPGNQVPPTHNPYDILSNNNLKNVIDDAMKDTEDETPLLVNVASTVLKSVKDIPSNIDTMFNDFGSFYRKTLFKLKDSVKDSMPEMLYKLGRGGSKYKSQYRDEFLDGYGV